MHKNIIFAVHTGILVLLVSAGCRSKEAPAPQEFVNVPVYVAAQTIPADDQAKIRSAPVTRSYAVGRYIDPNRGTVMHEQHTIYREEQSPSWNLIPQPDADPVLMAQKQRQERYADVLAGQVTLASEAMRDTHEIVRQVLEGQSSQEAKSKELVRLIDELKKQYGGVSGNLVRSSEYINKLEIELNKMQKELELLKLHLRRKGE